IENRCATPGKNIASGVYRYYLQSNSAIAVPKEIRDKLSDNSFFFDSGFVSEETMITSPSPTDSEFNSLKC
ncbi:hypothetical protein ACX95O_004633, partial [Citrobacter freundii]